MITGNFLSLVSRTKEVPAIWTVCCKPSQGWRVFMHKCCMRCRWWARNCVHCSVCSKHATREMKIRCTHALKRFMPGLPRKWTQTSRIHKISRTWTSSSLCTWTKLTHRSKSLAKGLITLILVPPWWKPIFTSKTLRRGFAISNACNLIFEFLLTWQFLFQVSKWDYQRAVAQGPVCSFVARGQSFSQQSQKIIARAGRFHNGGPMEWMYQLQGEQLCENYKKVHQSSKVIIFYP